ncbi:hypothetical protein RchiOBHm_Chr5g0049621 [Rosa chinensis]|uniref:Uncharacterized protein n=1 Tax=Rosa chinensis TaxID=74649 RepID=A0A2P6QEW3_ROSCH|nr:hypothetical protein RchiOBHm_Chr5g0049621 [Rosa chinensis]
MQRNAQVYLFNFRISYFFMSCNNRTNSLKCKHLQSPDYMLNGYLFYALCVPDLFMKCWK